MFNISIHRTLFKICLQKQKEEEQNRNFCFVFSTLLKVSGAFRVDLALEKLRTVACKLFALVCFVFLGAAPTLCTGGYSKPAPFPTINPTTALFNSCPLRWILNMNCSLTQTGGSGGMLPIFEWHCSYQNSWR